MRRTGALAALILPLAGCALGGAALTPTTAPIDLPAYALDGYLGFARGPDLLLLDRRGDGRRFKGEGWTVLADERLRERVDAAKAAGHTALALELGGRTDPLGYLLGPPGRLDADALTLRLADDKRFTLTLPPEPETASPST